MENSLVFIMPFVGIMLVCALIAFVFLLRVKANIRYTRAFAAVFLLWTLSFALEIIIAREALVALLKLVEYAFLQFLPGLLLLAVAEQPHDANITKGALVFALLAPALLALMALTNDLHHLFFSSVLVSETTAIALTEHAYGFNAFILVAGVQLAAAIIEAGRIFRAAHLRYQRSLRILIVFPMLPYAALLLGVALDIAFCVEFMQTGMFVVLVALCLMLFSAERPFLHPPRAEAMDALPIAYITMDAQNRIVDINALGERVLGSAKELLGQPIEEVLFRWCGHNIDLHQEELLAVKVPVGPYFEYYELSASVRDGRQTLVIINITSHKLEQEQDNYFANIDLLTGLPSRSLFTKLLQRELDNLHRYDDKLVLLSISVQNLDEISSLYGLAMTDRLIRDLGGILLAQFREVDTIARMEDDTFNVILPRIKNLASSVDTIFARMFHVFETPQKIAGEMILVRLCVGAAIAPYDGETLEELVSSAHLARRHAALQEKSFYFFNEESKYRNDESED